MRFGYGEYGAKVCLMDEEIGMRWWKRSWMEVRGLCKSYGPMGKGKMLFGFFEVEGLVLIAEITTI